MAEKHMGPKTTKDEGAVRAGLGKRAVNTAKTVGRGISTAASYTPLLGRLHSQNKARREKNVREARANLGLPPSPEAEAAEATAAAIRQSQEPLLRQLEMLTAANNPGMEGGAGASARKAHVGPATQPGDENVSYLEDYNKYVSNAIKNADDFSDDDDLTHLRQALTTPEVIDAIRSRYRRITPVQDGAGNIVNMVDLGSPVEMVDPEYPKQMMKRRERLADAIANFGRFYDEEGVQDLTSGGLEILYCLAWERGAWEKADWPYDFPSPKELFLSLLERAAKESAKSAPDAKSRTDQIASYIGSVVQELTKKPLINKSARINEQTLEQARNIPNKILDPGFAEEFLSPGQKTMAAYAKEFREHATKVLDAGKDDLVTLRFGKGELATDDSVAGLGFEAAPADPDAADPIGAQVSQIVDKLKENLAKATNSSKLEDALLSLKEYENEPDEQARKRLENLKSALNGRNQTPLLVATLLDNMIPPAERELDIAVDKINKSIAEDKFQEALKALSSVGIANAADLEDEGVQKMIRLIVQLRGELSSRKDLLSYEPKGSDEKALNLKEAERERNKNNISGILGELRALPLNEQLKAALAAALDGVDAEYRKERADSSADAINKMEEFMAKNLLAGQLPKDKADALDKVRQALSELAKLGEQVKEREAELAELPEGLMDAIGLEKLVGAKHAQKLRDNYFDPDKTDAVLTFLNAVERKMRAADAKEEDFEALGKLRDGVGRLDELAAKKRDLEGQLYDLDSKQTPYMEVVAAEVEKLRLKPINKELDRITKDAKKVLENDPAKALELVIDYEDRIRYPLYAVAKKMVERLEKSRKDAEFSPLMWVYARNIYKGDVKSIPGTKDKVSWWRSFWYGGKWRRNLMKFLNSGLKEIAKTIAGLPVVYWKWTWRGILPWKQERKNDSTWHLARIAGKLVFMPTMLFWLAVPAVAQVTHWITRITPKPVIGFFIPDKVRSHISPESIRKEMKDWSDGIDVENPFPFRKVYLGDHEGKPVAEWRLVSPWHSWNPLDWSYSSQGDWSAKLVDPPNKLHEMSDYGFYAYYGIRSEENIEWLRKNKDVLWYLDEMRTGDVIKAIKGGAGYKRVEADHGYILSRQQGVNDKLVEYLRSKETTSRDKALSMNKELHEKGLLWKMIPADSRKSKKKWFNIMGHYADSLGIYDQAAVDFIHTNDLLKQRMHGWASRGHDPLFLKPEQREQFVRFAMAKIKGALKRDINQVYVEDGQNGAVLLKAYGVDQVIMEIAKENESKPPSERKFDELVRAYVASVASLQSKRAAIQAFLNAEESKRDAAGLKAVLTEADLNRLRSAVPARHGDLLAEMAKEASSKELEELVNLLNAMGRKNKENMLNTLVYQRLAKEALDKKWMEDVPQEHKRFLAAKEVAKVKKSLQGLRSDENASYLATYHETMNVDGKQLKVRAAYELLRRLNKPGSKSSFTYNAEKLDEFAAAIRKHTSAGGRVEDFDPFNNGSKVKWAVEMEYITDWQSRMKSEARAMGREKRAERLAEIEQERKRTQKEISDLEAKRKGLIKSIAEVEGKLADLESITSRVFSSAKSRGEEKSLRSADLNDYRTELAKTESRLTELRGDYAKVSTSAKDFWKNNPELEKYVRSVVDPKVEKNKTFRQAMANHGISDLKQYLLDYVYDISISTDKAMAEERARSGLIVTVEAGKLIARVPADKSMLKKVLASRLASLLQ